MRWWAELTAQDLGDEARAAAWRAEVDAWSFDDPTTATLFKRRTAAKAIQSLLRSGVFVVPCTVDDRGRLVPESIAGRKVGKIELAVQPSWRKKKRAVRR